MRTPLGIGALLIGGLLGQEKPAPLPRVVLGYYPAWVAHPSVKEIRYERFTHLVHAFLQADSEGSIKENKALPNPELVRRAHEKKVRVLLSLGGAGSARTFRRIVRGPESRRRYLAAVAKAVADGPYDGVDLDWEPTESDEDRQGVVALVSALREALPSALISMAAPPTDWYGRWWDGAALASRVDLLNVMCYDFHGPWSDHAGHNAPLNAAPDDADGAALCVAAAMTYWAETRKWPRERLNLGIPCFGRGFAVKAWHQKPAGKAEHESIDARDVAGLLERGWFRAWDAKVGVPTLLNEGLTELISYEDPESAALKGAWAREKGLRGLFFWNIAQDWAQGDHAIVRAAAASFLK